ncbi:multidrug and toxin extrusion protein 1-like [Dendropsophus ebraccatus]|uniref:multidrug and toxin extrusion protein 1-like n=1 Tax=Dendropsophus ebraccatus TaxID=150705 RepID=UPI003831CD67
MSGSCCPHIPHRIKDIFHDYVGELQTLLWFTGPLALAMILDVVPLTVTSVFVGHVGKAELDAIMLAITFTALTGVAVGLGLNVACDTLLSQIYGGGNFMLIGIIVQRAILILTLTCFPCWALYINTENILRLCGQNKDVARQAELCVLILAPELPAYFFFQLGLRFLQNQEVLWPQIIISSLAGVVTALTNYLLLFVLEIGVIGGALAIAVGALLKCILLFLYIYVRKLHVISWPGWSLECLNDWGPFLALGIPGILIHSIDFWAFELAMILSGLKDLVELEGQSIIIQLLDFLQKIPFAFGIAASVRVGGHLGAERTDQAIKSAKLSMIIAGTLALFVSILLIALRRFLGEIFTSEKPRPGTLALFVSILLIALRRFLGEIFTRTLALFVSILLIALRRFLGEIFTSEKDVLLLVYRTIPVCALFYVFIPSVDVFIGILKGVGKPQVAAVAYFGGHCFIAFPIGVPLMFLAKLGIQGFWIGMLIAFVIINIFFSLYFWRLDWNLMTEKAKERVGIKKEPVKCLERGIDTPDTIKLSHYGALDSSNQEAEPQETADKSAKKKLIIRRVLQALGAVSTLIIGLIIKLTVKYQ